MMRLLPGGGEEFPKLRRRRADCVAMLLNRSTFQIVLSWGLGALLQSPRSPRVASKSVNEDDASAGQELHSRK
jgi:hypothetical protein